MESIWNVRSWIRIPESSCKSSRIDFNGGSILFKVFQAFKVVLRYPKKLLKSGFASLKRSIESWSVTALTIIESIRVKLSHLLRPRTPSKFKQIFTSSKTASVNPLITRWPTRLSGCYCGFIFWWELLIDHLNRMDASRFQEASWMLVLSSSR